MSKGLSSSTTFSLKMRPHTSTLLALVPLLNTLGYSQGSLLSLANPDLKSINTDDVKASYEHVAARYASWANRKELNEAQKSGLLYSSLKLDTTPTMLDEAALNKLRKRGTVINLHAVGGYPKMLGQTYNAAVGMGTPAQLFNLTADTGSMLTWAVQTSCKEADCPGVQMKETYDPAKSTTSRKMGSDHVAYGDGEMDVTLFSDVVGLDLVFINATIGGARKTFEKDGKLEHDGLLGLGRKKFTPTDPEPVLDSLAKQDKHFNEMIALDLGAQATMEIGGYDFVKYPKLSNFRVTGDEGWTLAGSSITAQGAANSAPCDLLLDTGSSVSMLPSSRMEAIMSRPGLKVERTKEEPIVYSMPCDTKLGVQLVLPDGTKVNVPDEDILMKSNDPKTPGCLSLLVGTTNPFLPAVAGTPILKSLYTVLRKTPTGDWISLAPLESGPHK